MGRSGEVPVGMASASPVKSLQLGTCGRADTTTRHPAKDTRPTPDLSATPESDVRSVQGAGALALDLSVVPRDAPGPGLG